MITKIIKNNINNMGKLKFFILLIFYNLINYFIFPSDINLQRNQFIQSANLDFLTKNKDSDYYIAEDYIDSLALQDRLSIYERYSYLPGLDDDQLGIHYEWYEIVSNFEGLIINISKPEKHHNEYLYSISIGTPLYNYSTIYFSEFVKEKTKLSFNTWNYEGQQRQIIQFDYYSEVNNFSNEEKKYTYDVDLIFDGDYVDFYLYGKFVHRFCKLNEKTYKQLFSLFQENKVDLTKVTWPKHADGSCDYNTKDLLTNIKLSSIMYNQIDIPIYEIQETNSSVICNLKKNSKVLVQRIGKKEKINGFEDNWVQVEVQQESNGVTDEDFVIGTVGWCYGGYLKESKSVDNTDLKKKEEKISDNNQLEQDDEPVGKKSSSLVLPVILICAGVLQIVIAIIVLVKKKQKKQHYFSR